MISKVNKKSQAALEFIMTYGWAILVVLVAIGALAYFGVLNPDRFLPSKCTLQAGIACLDHKVEAPTTGVANGRVTVYIQNSLGFDISSISVGAGDCGNYPGSAGSTGVLALANNAQQKYEIPCVAGSQISTTSSKYNEQVNVTYTVTDTTISHRNIGVLTARIE